MPAQPSLWPAGGHLSRSCTPKAPVQGPAPTNFLPGPFGGNRLFLLELAPSLRVHVRSPMFHGDCEPCEAARLTHSSVCAFQHRAVYVLARWTLPRLTDSDYDNR